jgi:hypothetical protein
MADSLFHSIDRRRPAPWYRRQLDRATGEVKYYAKLPPGFVCGGPVEPYWVTDTQAAVPSWAYLEECGNEAAFKPEGADGFSAFFRPKAKFLP